MLLGDSLIVDVLIALVAALLGLFYYKLTSTNGYWRRRGIPYVEPTIFFGNLKEQFFLKKSIFYILQDIYNELAGERFGGYFETTTPVLMIRDPALVERILIKDFSYFSDRDFPADPKRDPLSANLFSLRGDVWRNLRNKLTPTFTTGKLKGMIEQMCKSGEEFVAEIEKTTKSTEAVDAKKLGSIFTIDVIGSCAFGLQFKPGSPEGKEFRDVVKELFSPSVSRALRVTVLFFVKPLAKILKLKQASNKVNDYVIGLVKQTMEFRKKNGIHRNDFLQLMMDLKSQEDQGLDMNWKKELSEEDAYLNQMDYTTNKGSQEAGLKVMTDECIAANSFVFLTGGSEATASTVAYVLYELSSNPRVQTQLHTEIDSVLEKNGRNITYQSLKEMSYLDLILQETFRKYALGGFLRRVCNTPYRIPDSNVVLEVGTKVVIPLLALHNDPAYYPEPEKFIPERFEGNNHRSNGGKYLPFGDGPRVCIAMRFVILELKMCIATVMSNYSVSLDPKTEIPIRFHPKSFSLTPIGGIWVKFQRRLSN